MAEHTERHEPAHSRESTEEVSQPAARTLTLDASSLSSTPATSDQSRDENLLDPGVRLDDYEIVYPPEPDSYYRLTDGTGLQAFVLVVSSHPLPPFTTWPARSGLAWKPASGGDAWRFDGRDFAFLGDPSRGTERRAPALPPVPFASVCHYLSQLPDVDVVQATVFPVLPAEESTTSAKSAP